jgi:hypothetical protein
MGEPKEGPELFMTTQNLPWQKLFTAAMLEIEPSQLGAKIKAAMAAIEQRQRALTLKPQEEEIDEVRQLRDAVLTLRSLEKMELGSCTLPKLQPEKSSEGPSI